MSKQITIRMPKELLAKWLAALRGGEYAQCRMAMKSLEVGGRPSYCCLGVLVEVSGEDPATEEHSGVPSEQWAQRHGVSFTKAPAGAYGHPCNPHLPGLGTTAADANDQGRTFAEIADAIEACAEGY